MRVLPIGAVLLCALGCSPARKAASPPTAEALIRAAFEAKVDRLCTGPSSVPLEIAGSREFVEVTLPGSKTPGALRFHVDTGGNTAGLMVRHSAIEKLGFSSAASLPRTVHVGERDIALPEGADWIVVADDDPFVKFDDDARKGFSVGQLGAGFLSRFVVCVDPAHKRLGLGDPKEFNLVPGDAKWVPLLMMPGGENHALYPFVQVLLLNHGDVAGGYGVLLDTGATTSMLDRGKIEYQRTKHPDWGFANGAFGDADMLGGQWAEEVIAVPDVALHTPGDPASYGSKEPAQIDLGPARFVDRPTGTWGRMFGDLEATMGSHGAIANDVLLRYRLVLDYPHARLFVQPGGWPQDASASSARVGVAVRFGADGCPEIRRISDTNGPEARSKLRIGDVIVAIDGKPSCGMWHHEVQAALAGEVGARKKLRVRRGEGTVDVEVGTAELLGPR